MRLFGLDIRRAVTPVAAVPTDRGWRAVVREPFTGAWQQNQELAVPSVVANAAVYACVTLIASDIAKMRLRLVAEGEDDVWSEVFNSAYSPVLRKPNRYQTIIKFVEAWIVSKLLHGNAYILKQRDDRGVVSALYPLDPRRVTVLVAADGAVYYQLATDDLNGIPPPPPGQSVVVPASEMIHDLMIALFHPLIGVSPIYACGLAALQGLKIQENSSTFFGNGSTPGGVLTAPGAIGDDTAGRLKKYWDDNFSGANVGKVAVLGDGLKYEAMSVSAVDSQLIEQLKWSAETVCSCFHVPAIMIGASTNAPAANPEQLLQLYYSQCLHALVASFELSLDEGLELNAPLGTEFDVDDLLWMDTATRVKAAADAIGSGALSPNEARQKYFGLGPVPGGDTPYLQQQYFSLAALSVRDQNDPFSKPEPAPAAVPAATVTDGEDDGGVPVNLKALTAADGLALRGLLRARLGEARP